MLPLSNSWCMDPVYKHGLTLISAWINNCLHYKGWEKILIHSQNSTAAPLKFANGQITSSHALSSMPRLKLFHNKKGPWLQHSPLLARRQRGGHCLLICYYTSRSWLRARLYSLHWRHNGCDSVSNLQPYDCLLNRLFRHRSKKTSKLRVTGLCVGNSPGTGEFPTQMSSNSENVSIWWRHHVVSVLWRCTYHQYACVGFALEHIMYFCVGFVLECVL